MTTTTMRSRRRRPTPVADRRRAALERLHGGADRRPGAPPRPAATIRRRGTDRRPGVWDVQRGPAPAAYYVIGIVVAVFVMLGLVMVLSASASRRGGQGQQPVPHLQPPGDVGRRSASSGCSSAMRMHLAWVRRLAIPLVVLAGLGDGAAVRARRRLDASTTPGRGSRSARSACSRRSSSSWPSSCSPPTCWCAARTCSPTSAAACARSPSSPCAPPAPAWPRATSARRS